MPAVPPPDVVYVVRPGDDNEELRFSLRSLANLPHGRVWIAGHCPAWVTNVETIPVTSRGSKYESSTANLRAAAEHADVSERFVYCNDDFFILEPLAEVPVLHRGPVSDVLADYQRRFPGGGDYAAGMSATVRLLEDRFDIVDPLSYELHVPMVMERRKLLVALDAAESWGRVRALHKRTLYGNLWRIGGSRVDDCKLRDEDSNWTPGPFASTCDRSFAWVHGRTIRSRFPSPSRYERVGTQPQEDMMGVTLRHRNGAVVTVSEEKAERLASQGFKRVGSAQPQDYASMTVADLRAELDRRGLPTAGKKADLVAALQSAD